MTIKELTTKMKNYNLYIDNDSNEIFIYRKKSKITSENIALIDKYQNNGVYFVKRVPSKIGLIIIDFANTPVDKRGFGPAPSHLTKEQKKDLITYDELKHALTKQGLTLQYFPDIKMTDVIKNKSRHVIANINSSHDSTHSMSIAKSIPSRVAELILRYNNTPDEYRHCPEK